MKVLGSLGVASALLLVFSLLACGEDDDNANSPSCGGTGGGGDASGFDGWGAAGSAGQQQASCELGAALANCLVVVSDAVRSCTEHYDSNFVTEQTKLNCESAGGKYTEGTGCAVDGRLGWCSSAAEPTIQTISYGESSAAAGLQEECSKAGGTWCPAK